MSNKNDILKIIRPIRLRSYIFCRSKFYTRDKLYQQVTSNLDNISKFIKHKKIYELEKYKQKLKFAIKINASLVTMNPMYLVLSGLALIISLITFNGKTEIPIVDNFTYIFMLVMIVIVTLCGISFLWLHKICATYEYLYEHAIELIDQRIASLSKTKKVG